jgi:hypothetical protein
MQSRMLQSVRNWTIQTSLFRPQKVVSVHEALPVLTVLMVLMALMALLVLPANAVPLVLPVLLVPLVNGALPVLMAVAAKLGRVGMPVLPARQGLIKAAAVFLWCSLCWDCLPPCLSLLLSFCG